MVFEEDEVQDTYSIKISSILENIIIEKPIHNGF